jgi:SAM-dependent methyltransferase
MSESTSIDAQKVFAPKAAAYNRRPEWPKDSFLKLLRLAGFDPGNSAAMQDLVIADIGAGTGRTSEIFLKLGCTVIAVEPNAEMRARLQTLKDKNSYQKMVITDGDALNPKVPAGFAGKINLAFSANSPHW